MANFQQVTSEFLVVMLQSAVINLESAVGLQGQPVFQFVINKGCLKLPGGARVQRLLSNPLERVIHIG